MSPSPVRLAALIVTHNRREKLELCLAHTLAQGFDRVLVIDNASDDGTAAWLARQDDPRLEVLRLAENGGGAGGFAAGLARLAGPGASRPDSQPDSQPDWIALFDDDAWPGPGAVAAFRARADGLDPDCAGPGAIAALGAAVLTPAGRPAELNRPALNPFWHIGTLLRSLAGGGREGFHLHEGDYAPEAPERAVDALSFVGFFLARGAVARAGLPDAGLFIYGDDTIYSLTLRRAGLGLRFCPAIRFVHDCGHALAPRPIWKVYYLCRNGVRMARAAAGPWLFALALGWYLLAWTRKARLYPPAERRLYRRMMRAGLRDGLRGRGGANPAIHRMALEATAESR